MPENDATEAKQETENGSSRDKVSRMAIIPSAVTLANAFVGLMALAQSFKAYQNNAPEHLVYASWFIFLGMAFDGLDGKIARITESSSPFGIQLDSLCDALTFGVAPAMMMYSAVLTLRDAGEGYPLLEKVSFPLAALYVIAVLVRLARYNVEKDREDKNGKGFAGLPSPAGAGLIAAGFLMTIYAAEGYFPEDMQGLRAAVKNQPLNYYLQASPLILLTLAALNVSRIRYFHFLNRIMNRDLSIWYAFGGLLIVLVVIIEPEYSLFVIFVLYTVSGPLNEAYLFSRNLLTADDAPPGASPDE